ncbi:hypothetical protein ANO11243_011980 [Dothideomycetidae sp. 11243]|nr:hypothetical protein ANO11243_011980 [fungal sp. No.11243]
MPGRLVMDVKDPISPGGLKRDGSHLLQQSEGPDLKRVATMNDVASPKTNGYGPLAASTAPATNGVHKDHMVSTENHIVKSEHTTDEPPQIEQFRETLVPFGMMLERMAQQTYFDLTETIELLADMRVQQQTQLTNGVGSQMPLDKSSASVDKKLRLLNFAQSHKDRFIKALVLSDWARNIDDMSKLIDVSMFLRKQDWSTAAAADGIYRLKENMVGAKMPNPNIEGALELLSTGQAVWMPDLGLIPGGPLRAEELLETLTDMNFALSVRLTLNEVLPTNFNNYSISNGRVTFFVQDEFEVDLAIADQDPESPFYFIDLRLIFRPSNSSAHDRMRNQLEAQVNAVLLSSGLKGCYDFLHNFVLTHKLNILRCQALDLARGRWIENIEVQSVHRMIIIQYWRDLPGGRNWIELGIASGRSEGPIEDDSKSPPASQLFCRWFRRGQEILHHGLVFEFSDLCVEKMLDHVIATHVTGRLSVISDGLQNFSEDSTVFSQTLYASQLSPRDCHLEVALRTLSTTLKITIDPIRGLYTAYPGTADTSELERRMNESGVDVSLIIRNFLCRNVLQNVTEQAQSIGLLRVASNVRIKPPFTASNEAATHRVFHLPAISTLDSGQQQRSHFILLATVDFPHGLSWYLSEIDGSEDNEYLQFALGLENTNASGRLDRSRILTMESLAVKTASSLQITRELRQWKVPFKVAHGRLVGAIGTGEQATIYLDVSDIMATEGMPKTTTSPAPAFAKMATLSCCRPNGGNVEYILRSWLRNGTPPKLIHHLRDALRDALEINVDTSGGLLISVRTPLGRPILALLRERLTAVARLYSFIQVTNDYRFGIVRATLEGLCFKYSEQLTCTAMISRSSGGPLLEFGTTGSTTESNPHNRIRYQLETTVVSRSVHGEATGMELTRFRGLCAILRASLPIVESMQKLAGSEPACSALLMCHSATMFKLAFKAPLPTISFQISGKYGRGKIYWIVRLVEVKSFSETSRRNLSQLWRERGKGWRGLRTAAMAGVEGIGDLLDRINTLLRQPEDHPPTSDATSGGAQPGQTSSGRTANRPPRAPSNLLPHTRLNLHHKRVRLNFVSQRPHSAPYPSIALAVALGR